MNFAIVGLLAESIGFARDILHIFTSRTSSVPSPGDGVSITHEKTIVHENRSVTLIRERVLDEKTLRKVIDDTNRHLESLLEIQSREILDELRRQRVRDALQEVQARVAALKLLLNGRELDSTVAMQLVISALNPLQVSLEVAKFRLQDYGDKEAWQFCYIVGTSALLSGYGFLGQDMPHMRAELKESMYSIQKLILNRAAARIIAAGNEVPWEQVPQLLTPEGVETLLELYRSADTEEVGGESEPIACDLESMTVNEVRSLAQGLEDANVLVRLIAEERNGKNRTGALEALRGRLNHLSE